MKPLTAVVWLWVGLWEIILEWFPFSSLCLSSNKSSISKFSLSQRSYPELDLLACHNLQGGVWNSKSEIDQLAKTSTTFSSWLSCSMYLRLSLAAHLCFNCFLSSHYRSSAGVLRLFYLLSLYCSFYFSSALTFVSELQRPRARLWMPEPMNSMDESVLSTFEMDAWLLTSQDTKFHSTS